MSHLLIATGLVGGNFAAILMLDLTIATAMERSVFQIAGVLICWVSASAGAK